MTRVIRSIAVALIFCAVASIAHAQADPKNGAPVVMLNAVTATTTSPAYAVLGSPGTVVYVKLSTPDGATGSLKIQGTLDSEASVSAGTADWIDLTTTLVMTDLLYVSDPLPYIRVIWTRTGGTLTVKMRGASFRRVP